MMNRRPASEMAVALWAWWSFARMAFLESSREEREKRRARHAGQVGISFLARPVCLGRRAFQLTNIL